MIKYTSVSRILSKIHRELGDVDLNETDILEFIGEAMSFLSAPQMQEEVVAFLEVVNNEADAPVSLVNILQIARNNSWSKPEDSCAMLEEFSCNNFSCDDLIPDPCAINSANQAGYPVPLDCNGIPIIDFDVTHYRPYFDLQWEYHLWTNSSYYTKSYTPVRLANNTFFNSVVLKEKKDIYKNCVDEYTIVGDKEKIRFSFKEGSVAISYLKMLLDEETGYPLIPDEPNTISAISYYVRWKIAERLSWTGREGSSVLSREAEAKWHKYLRQAKSYMKMPKTIDEYQNLLEMSHQMIPNKDRYYDFFSKINQSNSLSDIDTRGKRSNRYNY